MALFEKGETLFGNSEEFINWLKKPFWGASEKPIDWIKTSGGVDLVLDEMDKLSEGYPI